ncbi:MAG: hypothetical protein OEM01_08060 [Desulfobulbaceae bacterium]|nr:hypothetical protein [Desulfobulbaceae bacterium]
MASAVEKKKVLITFFSFSSQTNNLILALSRGMEKYNVEVIRERLIPVNQLRFPIGTIQGTLRMMLVTFFRKRIPIEPIANHCFDDYDLIILAGPTWSYNPSGPILKLFDRDGERLFRNKLVLPLISCRGYWRLHWWGLKRLLCKKGAKVVNLIVFSHPNPEPWRTIGVFLKLAGRIPEKKSWFAGKYRKYGHTKKQLQEAKRFGKMMGKELVQGGKNLHHLNFDTGISRP